ncbi:MAG: DUF2141 domain-containing protein [Deltaproteobacteria bacterium]|nr:DUF2141 domain-containing protein [Deltaproteobacteria bacterium]
MRKRFITSIMVLFMLCASTLYAQTGTLTVTVNRIDAEKGGKVNIGIYDAKGFPEIGKQLHGIDLDINGPSATYVFKDIPVGKYAIAVFQDENMDGKLNKNIMGIPKEPYGFSKNKYGMFGPPKFKDVSFEVTKESPVLLTINLK